MAHLAFVTMPIGRILPAGVGATEDEAYSAAVAFYSELPRGLWDRLAHRLRLMEISDAEAAEHGAWLAQERAKVQQRRTGKA